VAKADRIDVAALPTSAGKIQMLDLAALKMRLGPKWDRMAGPVQMFFEAAIRRNLAPGDSFYRASELSYLVVFRGLNDAQTECKCTAISEEVCQRLFGDGEAITVRNLIAHFSPHELPAGGDHIGGLDALLERKGREVLVSKSAVDEHHCEPDLRVRLVNRATAPQRVALRDIALVYRPVWDCNKNAVLTYFCQPALGPLAAGADFSSAYVTAAESGEDAVIDRIVLEKCVDQARKLRSEGVRIIFAVPVHFSTVSRMRSWQAYSALHRQIPKDIAQDLAFLVLGIDKGVPHIRLVQELPKLALGAYRVLCVVGESEGLAARFARTGAHGVGVALTQQMSETQAQRLIGGVARESRAARLDSFALDLQSTSLVLSAVNAGVRYLEGSAVRPALAEPRYAFGQDVADLYRGKIANSTA
jgi:hypothetical protein